MAFRLNLKSNINRVHSLGGLKNIYKYLHFEFSGCTVKFNNHYLLQDNGAKAKCYHLVKILLNLTKTSHNKELTIG